MPSKPKQLHIDNLHVRVDGKEVLHGVSLTVNQGEVHAIMGPNGSGKSTLSQAIFGHPQYEVTEGRIVFDGTDITTLSPDKRANMGLFLAFQQPHSIPGVNIGTFLKQAINAKRHFQHPKEGGMKMSEYREVLKQAMKNVHMKKEFAERYLNTGFSGGEKKKSEILQMALLKPDIAVIDEIDSGLDVDALRVVAENINALRAEQQMGVVIITHYPRILQYIVPDHVHILRNGELVESGDASLAQKIEEQGYDWLT